MWGETSAHEPRFETDVGHCDSARAGGGALPVIMSIIRSSRNPRLPQLDTTSECAVQSSKKRGTKPDSKRGLRAMPLPHVRCDIPCLVPCVLDADRCLRSDVIRCYDQNVTHSGPKTLYFKQGNVPPNTHDPNMEFVADRYFLSWPFLPHFPHFPTLCRTTHAVSQTRNVFVSPQFLKC